MTAARDQHGLDYIDADIPAGMTIHDWRVRRVQAVQDRRRRPVLRWLADHRGTLRRGRSRRKAAT